MTSPTPESFWRAFKKAIASGTQDLPVGVTKREAYESDSLWTRLAIGAAKAACEELGLESSQEYFRVDLIGFTRGAHHRDGDEFRWYDWHLKVAFEHENTKEWRDELCKLAHLAADLCVLVSYYGPGENIEELLGEALDVLGDRMTRVQGREWLLAFGPNIHEYRANPDASFKAFTMGHDGQLVPLQEETPLRPGDWQS